MWVYPYKDEREHVIYNMVNGLLLRPYMSGMVWDMGEESLELMREGKYDQILKRMENVLDLSKEHRFCGKDGIWVGAE